MSVEMDGAETEGLEKEVATVNGHYGPERCKDLIASLPKGKTITIWIQAKRDPVPTGTAKWFLALFDGNIAGTLYMGPENRKLQTKKFEEKGRCGTGFRILITDTKGGQHSCEFEPARSLPPAKMGRPKKEDTDPEYDE